MNCEALASIELGIKANPTLRFIPWAEIKARMTEKTRNSKFLHCLPMHISHRIKNEVQHSDKALVAKVRGYKVSDESHKAARELPTSLSCPSADHTFWK